MADIRSVIRELEDRFDRVAQLSYIRMCDLMILPTPYDTSSAQASWTPSRGGPVSRYVEMTAGPRYPQRATVVAVGNSLRVGQTASLANGAPYIGRLEYGWSGQAQGFVRSAIAQWQAVAQESAGIAARGG